MLPDNTTLWAAAAHVYRTLGAPLCDTRPNHCPDIRASKPSSSVRCPSYLHVPAFPRLHCIIPRPWGTVPSLPPSPRVAGLLEDRDASRVLIDQVVWRVPRPDRRSGKTPSPRTRSRSSRAWRRLTSARRRQGRVSPSSAAAAGAARARRPRSHSGRGSAMGSASATAQACDKHFTWVYW